MTSTTSVSSIVATRYARAFVDLADEAKVTDKVAKDLESLINMVEGSDDLAMIIRTPVINKAAQLKSLDALGTKAKFQKLTQNFLGLLVQNRRLYAVEQIIRAVQAEISKRAGEITATVQTTTKLSAKQTKDLETAISKSVGASVSLKAETDPEILGGMILTVGSHMVDDSVRRKLDRLRNRMGAGSNQNTELKEAS